MVRIQAGQPDFLRKSGAGTPLIDPTNRRVIGVSVPNRYLMWYVYIIKCNDNKLYTGITTDIDRRLTEHNTGHGGRFTRVRKPVELVYSEKLSGKSAALKKEIKIKQLSRSEKLKLTKF